MGNFLLPFVLRASFPPLDIRYVFTEHTWRMPLEALSVIVKEETLNIIRASQTWLAFSDIHLLLVFSDSLLASFVDNHFYLVAYI